MSAPQHWVEAVLPHVLAPDAIVLIDGRSGSGKSTLAQQVVEHAARQGVSVQLIHMEDIYPGWDGLDEAVRILAADIIGPLAAGRAARWPTYDWHRDAPGPQQTAQPGRPVLIEGVGALSADSAPLASWRVWLEAPADLRRRRALARDGELYHPHWGRWAQAEDAFIDRHRPAERADIIIEVGEKR